MANSSKTPKGIPPSPAFLKTLGNLGILPTEVENGRVVRRPVLINTIAEFKELFGNHIPAATRSDYTDKLRKTKPEAFKDNTELHLQTRLAAHVYGDYPLSTGDNRLGVKYFPLKIMIEAAVDQTITTPIVYGPSGSPVTLLYDNLTFTGQGSITTLGTILSLQATNIVVGNLSGGAPYLINIIGVDGADGAPGTAGTDYSGQQAANGQDASTPSPGICTGATSPTDGDNGADGGSATTDGTTGPNGLANLQANITITDTIAGLLTLYSRSGNGGNGGPGGAGGGGEQGGNGGNGCNTGCECTDGANGGNGGVGGNGSNGGNGGNAVDGNDSFVTVPAAYLNQIAKPGYDTATGGLGGAPGAAGNRGTGGSGGTTGTKHCTDGSNGQNGSYDGSIGTQGTDSKVNGAHGTIHITPS